jgi:hypothetical protein
MNIFVTNENPVQAARDLCDKHIPKMLLESTQMLSNAYHFFTTVSGAAPYKPLYLNHPCSKWAIESRGNFDWLFNHAVEINLEYERRFNKIHKCKAALATMWTFEKTLTFPKQDLTDHVYVMPLVYRCDSLIDSYRSYVKDAKVFAKWTKGTVKPTWYDSHEIQYNEKNVREARKNGVPIPQKAFSTYFYPVD